MKIAIISGSRSDRNALCMVADATLAAGHKNEWLELWTAIKYCGDPVSAMISAASYVGQRLLWLKPDIVVIHGDRHEVVGIAAAANMLGFPIAHVGGGDITEGSQDDCFRHAITKLSHLHFASNQDSADRIVQMGEGPDRVYVTGCPGIDMVMATPTLERTETFAAVGLCAPPCTESQSYHMTKEWREMCERPAPQRALLVLFHPNTLGDTKVELEAISVALARRTEALVLLGPNADAGSNLIRDEWKRLAVNRPWTVYHDNVEPALFYSLLKHCDVLVGNSSAGFYEAPCFGIPVINLGDRQRGRSRPLSMGQLDDSDNPEAIKNAVGVMMKLGRAEGHSSMYGDGHAAERIAAVIGGISDMKALLRKKFRTCPKLSGGYCSLDEKLEPLPLGGSST